MPRIGGSLGVKAAMCILALTTLVAILAPLLAPHDPNAIDLTDTVAGTSGAHWLGTDQLGRDTLSRLMFGARSSLLGPLLVVVTSTLVAVPVSLVAGYRRGILDAVTSRVWDALFGFPTLLLAIAVIAAFGPGFATATGAVSLIYIPLLARVVRGSVLLEREKPYIEACRAQRYGQARIVFGHLLPNIAVIVGAQSALNFGYALLDLTALTFLGFGVRPPTADWGQMLTDGRSAIIQHAYLEVVVASIAITIVVLSFNVVGYALAERWAARR
jgi:ABC-type dipeptide/oligopeptide/nickel transport system permease subunit